MAQHRHCPPAAPRARHRFRALAAPRAMAREGREGPPTRSIEIAVLRIGSRGVVDSHRRLVRGGVERDLPERHGNVGAALRMMIDLFRARQRSACHALRNEILRLLPNIHRDPPLGDGPARREADAKRQEPRSSSLCLVPSLALPRFRFYGCDLSRRFRQHPMASGEYRPPGWIGQAARESVTARDPPHCRASGRADRR